VGVAADFSPDLLDLADERLECSLEDRPPLLLLMLFSLPRPTKALFLRLDKVGDVTVHAGRVFPLVPGEDVASLPR
jgi:hypothetical protein